MRFGEGAAEDCEVLREDIDHTAIDGAPACNDAITRWALFFHAKISAAVGNESVELFKAVRV